MTWTANCSNNSTLNWEKLTDRSPSCLCCICVEEVAHYDVQATRGRGNMTAKVVGVRNCSDKLAIWQIALWPSPRPVGSKVSCHQSVPKYGTGLSCALLAGTQYTWFKLISHHSFIHSRERSNLSGNNWNFGLKSGVAIFPSIYIVFFGFKEFEDRIITG